MNKDEKIKLFQQQNVRTHWDESQEQWLFSIVDVVAILSASTNSQAYWRKLKQRLKAEGNETVTNCHGLKMLAIDGKMRLTDVANTAKQARLELEKQIGESVVSSKNAQQLLESDDNE